MKKILLFLMMISLFLLTGCITSSGSYKAIMCISNQTTTSFFMEYSSLDGHKQYNFSLDETKEVKLSFETEEGSLKLVISKDGEDFKEFEQIETHDEVLVLEAGSYTFYFLAINHKGAFRVSWK